MSAWLGPGQLDAAGALLRHPGSARQVLARLRRFLQGASPGSAEGSRERLRRSSSGLLQADEQFGAIILAAYLNSACDERENEAPAKKN